MSLPPPNGRRRPQGARPDDNRRLRLTSRRTRSKPNRLPRPAQRRSSPTSLPGPLDDAPEPESGEAADRSVSDRGLSEQRSSKLGPPNVVALLRSPSSQRTGFAPILSALRCPSGLRNSWAPSAAAVVRWRALAAASLPPFERGGSVFTCICAPRRRRPDRRETRSRRMRYWHSLPAQPVIWALASPGSLAALT